MGAIAIGIAAIDGATIPIIAEIVVDLIIAVVIDPITLLDRTRVNRAIFRLTIIAIIDAIVIVVIVAGITLLVPIVIVLFGIGIDGAVITAIRNGIVIVVLVDAICFAIEIGIDKTVVGH